MSIIIFLSFLFILLTVLMFARNRELNKTRKATMEAAIGNLQNFRPAKTIRGYNNNFTFLIDEDNEQVAVVTPQSSDIIKYSDIMGVEILENGSTISKKSTTRTVGGALIGGALSGGVGAIVGGLSGSTVTKKQVSSMSVKIMQRNFSKPSLNLPIINGLTVKTDDLIYKICRKNADEIRDIVSVIIDREDNKSNVPPTQHSSISDELIKLNSLKESGILTEDEFNIQKNKILNSN